MNQNLELEKHLDWLLNHSLQAGVLVVIVMAVQWIFRHRLTNRWRFALWWIVLARLLLPFSPQSAVSLFNVVQPAVHLEEPHQAVPVIPGRTATTVSKNNLNQFPSQNVSPAETELSQTKSVPAASPLPVSKSSPETSKSATSPVVPRHSLSFNDLVVPSLAGLWLAGVIILSSVVVTQSLRFHRRLARACVPSDAKLQELLDDCRREFGVSRRIELLETDAVKSPALFGLLRLRLLVPRGIGAQFAGRELRYIFLHEVAHVKRGDLWLNWLVTVLQVVHWFNPLLWFGFARLRADRELACDELALLCAGDNAGTAYGETVVKLLENLSRPAAIPGLVGILEDKKQMRRRISMIVNFRRPGRWSALAVVLIIALAAAALTDAQSSGPIKPPAQSAKAQPDSTDTTSTNLIAAATRPDLIGTVSAKGGAPLPVPATVFIATAGPKTGSSTFCPSCYADCAKHAQTDAQGNFKIESLDPQLTFRILAVAKGFKPKYVSKMDPVKGTPVKIELEPIESADASPDHILHGRVVDAKGQPVEGAVVEMSGVETRNGGGEWGAIDGVDPLAVTDDKGEFLLTATRLFDTMDVKVSARTFADKLFNKLPKGRPNELVIAEGAELTGRVLRDGKPLAGVSVGVAAVDRQAGKFLGHFEVATGPNGRFLLVNLPPDADFWLYTLMSSTKQSGAVPLQKIHAGKDSETTDAGDLVAMPTHHLAGRVVLADGQPVPPKTRLLMSREDAWDSMQITLDKDGNFDATGVPDETVTLSVRIPDYHVSGRNLSVDELNPYRLIGRVDRDITGLVFLLEKGPEPQPDHSHIDPDYNRSRNRTLRGAESAPDHSGEWAISGHVVDADSGQPIQNFLVTPGQSQNFDHTGWSTMHAVNGSNGVYQIYISKRAQGPALKVDADGYLPQVLNIQRSISTNVDFALKKGFGPAGTVLSPDGTPAVDASVITLSGEYNRAGLNARGELMTYGNRSALHKTDESGHFTFKPEWGVTMVIAASPKGFAMAEVDSLATNPVIQLQAFGKVSGTLKRTSGPGTNEDLDVEFPVLSDQFARLNLNFHAVTDSQGRFQFEGLPPGHLQISYRQELPGKYSNWQNIALKDFDLKSGQSLALNIEAGDRTALQTANNFQQPPKPKLISGAQIKGVVLLPDGKPAADADVALQVEGKYLGIGKGAFTGYPSTDGTMVTTGPDGSFTLPLYEKTLSVIALNEEGYAQISLEQLKKSPQITLQKWGRIEGTLRVGHHLGTNEQVTLSTVPKWSSMTIRQAGQTNSSAGVTITNSDVASLQRPIYDFNAFKAPTDENGKFVITFVPPGEQVVARLVPIGAGSWTHNPLATLDVQPGQTVVTNVGGGGRTVTCTLKFETNTLPEFNQGYATITTPMAEYREKINKLKTDEERKAFYASSEGQTFLKTRRSFSSSIQADGSFRAEEVLPGTYEVTFNQHFRPNAPLSSATFFASAQTFTVPPAANPDDDSTVDWGTVELKKHTVTVPGSASK